MYQLPSSVMTIRDEGNEAANEELRKAVESLDKKFEALARRIVGMEKSRL